MYWTYYFIMYWTIIFNLNFFTLLKKYFIINEKFKRDTNPFKFRRTFEEFELIFNNVSLDWTFPSPQFAKNTVPYGNKNTNITDLIRNKSIVYSSKLFFIRKQEDILGETIQHITQE